jgi:hypothetical protein
MTIDEIARLDFAYAPPFSAPFDPILIAAEQAAKKIQKEPLTLVLSPQGRGEG